MKRKQISFLLKTSALIIVIPTMAIADDHNGQDIYSEITSHPIDVVIRAEVFKSLDVVDRRGQDIGRVADFVIDFGESTLLYTLLETGTGTTDQMTESSGDAEETDVERENNTAEGWNQGALTSGNGEESDVDGESDTAEARNGQGSSYYPIPADALRLVERQDLLAALSGEGQADDGDEQSADSQSAEQANDSGQVQQTDIDEELARLTVNDVVGTSVVAEDGESITSVSEVAVLNQGVHFILGVGGFLGIGETDVAIRAQQFIVDAENDRFILPMTADQLRDMPHVDYDEEAVLPPDMLIREAFETAHSADGTEIRTEARGDQGATTGGESMQDHPLEGMVLMLAISRDDLDNAPSFAEGEFPDAEDSAWHQTIVNFYDEILGARAGNGSAMEASGDSDEAAADMPDEAEENAGSQN